MGTWFTPLVLLVGGVEGNGKSLFLRLPEMEMITFTQKTRRTKEISEKPAVRASWIYFTKVHTLLPGGQYSIQNITIAVTKSNYLMHSIYINLIFIYM